jgi:hypothetical protein
MSDVIHLLDPNMAPLTALTMKLRKAHCTSPKVEWLEDEYLPTTVTSSGTTITTAVSLVLTTGGGGNIRVNDVLKSLESGEVLHVTAVTTDTLTVTRAIGSTAAVQYATAKIFLIIGNANAEGASGRTLKTTTKTAVFNYTQIFRWPYGSTRTTTQSQLYGGDDLAFQAKKAGLEHRIQIERAFLFGERKEDVSGATPLRFTGGIIEKITSNTGVLTTPTLDTFETELRDAFRYGPAKKIMFASRLWISGLNKLATSSLIQTIPSTTSFPLALVEYVSGHGKLYIVTHNLLEGTGGNNQAYLGWSLILDMDSLFYRYLQGADTHIKPNIQANDEDARKDEYLSECAMMAIQQQNHAYVNGTTGF